MIDFEHARVEALKWISRIEDVKVLAPENTPSLPKSWQVWEINTEISFQDKFQDIQFHLILLEDFPLSLPKILLTELSFATYKYLPHTQSDRLICTYADSAQPDPYQPGLVIEQIIRKAKQIIVDGLCKINEGDYEEEFTAYWAGEYEKEEKVLENVLLIANRPLTTRIKVLTLQKDYAGYKYILHQNDDNALLLKKYFEVNDIKFDEVEGLNVGELPFKKPPFTLRNRQSLAFVEEFSAVDEIELKGYLNVNVFPKAIVFYKTIAGLQKYFGWFYKFPSLNRNGFRAGSITVQKALMTFNANDLTRRFNVEDISLERLSERSGGIHSPIKDRIISVVGLGSIGSNLVHFLNGGAIEFRFIDIDKLRVENIGRHLLGFKYVSEYKTKALQNFLLHKNPTQRISTRETSIVEILQNEIQYINCSDFIFVAIGNSNIERWVANAISEGILTAPTFFIWVEPYLAGGHCIFCHPASARFNQYFNATGDFIFNVIDQDEYINHNPKLSAREAGCQTAFVPYSASNTILFLSSLFPWINKLMETKSSSSRCFSWVGDLDLIRKLGITINPIYKDETFGHFIERSV